MDEVVAKRILFEFEVIFLMALFAGITLYAVLGSFRKSPSPGIGSEFEPLDLVLVWFPMILFLVNPILSFFSPELVSGAEPGEKSVGEQLTTIFGHFANFAFIGVITIVLIQWLLVRNAVEILGLRKLKVLPILLTGVVVTAFSILLCSKVLGDLSTDFLTDKLGQLDAQQAVVELKEARSVPIIVISLLIPCIVAPVVEEILFRGYFYGVLKRFTSPVFAVLISSALFAVVHVNLPALVPLWVFAIILTISYELSGCLWVPITIHALFNTTNVTLLGCFPEVTWRGCRSHLSRCPGEDCSEIGWPWNGARRLVRRLS